MGVNMPFIMLLVLFLSGCAATSVQQAGAEEDPRFVELKRQLREGRITNLEYARKGLALAREIHPNEKDKQALWAYAVLINGQAERGEITEEMADYLMAERTTQYHRDRELQNARLRQQYQQGITASDLFMLDAIRRPFDRMRAPTNCQSHTVAGVQYTDCY
jgi:hypothetical protein